MVTISRVVLLSAVLLSFSGSAEAAQPAVPEWSAYYSGGPYRSGQTVTLPDGTSGVIVGDFHTIGGYNQPGRFTYAVLVPKKGPRDAADCPSFGISVVRIEKQNGKNVVIDWPKSADDMIRDYQDKLAKTRANVLAATARGRGIQAEADKQFAKWNKRNDRSVAKFTTKEGYASLLFDMALAGAADKAKKGIRGTKGITDVERIFQETLVDMGKAKISADLPLSMPPLDGNKAATAEEAKGTIKAYLSTRLKGVPPDSRAEIVTNLIVAFGANAMNKEEDDTFAEAAFDAIGDIAIDVGLSEYPIAGPLAKEALELAKQLNGYLGVISEMNRADAEFTTAINAFNESYGAKQALELIQKHRAQILKAASDSLYKEDPKLEPWLVEQITARIREDRARMKEFTDKLPKRDVVGPVAPGGDKFDKVLIDDGWLLQMSIPRYIEDAERESALIDADRLGVPGGRYRMPARRGFAIDDFPSTRGDSRDPLDQMRRLFSQDPFRPGRGLTLELPQPPPKPNVDEKTALERDCRLKRMAEAERLYPRIGPQVSDALKFDFAIPSDLKLVPRGTNVGRFDSTRPYSVDPLPPAIWTTRAGLRR